MKFHPEGGAKEHAVRFLCLCAILALAAGFCPADTLSRPPFEIHHQPADLAHAEASADTLQDALREYSPRLPPGPAPIRVVIAGTLGDFLRRVGSFAQLRVSGVARADIGLIIVQSPSIRTADEDYNGTLRHELLHILLYRNTDTERLPRWLNEGLCMSFANEYHWQGGLAIARIFFSGRVIPLDKLDLAFSHPGDEQEFGDAYAQALSLVRYMRDQLGDETFWAVVLGCRTHDFETSLRANAGVELGQLWAGYRQSLWWVALIGAISSGSLLAPVSVLPLLTWWSVRRRNRRRLQEMAAEEQLAPEEDPYWEHNPEDDEEEDRP